MSSIKFVFFGQSRKPRCGNKCGTLYSGALYVALWASCLLLLWNFWTEFNKTWQEARSQCPLPSFCFSGRSVNKNVCLGQFLKKVVHCTQVHDMWPFGPLVKNRDLIQQYEVTLSRMFNDILTLDQLQWLSNQSDLISWPWHRIWPSPNYEWFPWSICNGCGMSAGNSYPSRHLILSLFGTSYWSNCWDHFSLTCPVFSQLFTFNIPRYFLDFALDPSRP